ncbi:MAG: acyltransferase [Colwellia sp.]|nr:acyltransferase [Colwellia sp.]
MGFIIKKLRVLYSLLYYVLFGSIAHARKKGVQVGDNCRLYIREWGSEPYLISIGDNVTVAADTKFITHDGSAWLFRNEAGRYYKYGRNIIGDNVFIGMNVLIFPGVTIGSNVIVGAGSVITKSLDAGYVYVGNPAKKLKSIEDFIISMKENYVHTSSVPSSFTDKERVFEMLSIVESRENNA